jgi:hypothetical protein
VRADFPDTQLHSRLMLRPTAQHVERVSHPRRAEATAS